MPIRALFDAAQINSLAAPYNTLHLKIFYPARFTGDTREKMEGIIAADETRAPFPIVILLNGINVTPEQYQWLVSDIVARGYVVVTYHLVSEIFPGNVTLSPGLDLKQVTPTTYGNAPSANALSAIFAVLAKHNAQGVLQNLLDLHCVVLGGHSAGGTVVLQNANPKFFPNVVAAFTYGAHAGVSTMLGFPPNTLLPTASAIPTLLLGGTRDGVIAASSSRYGLPEGDPTGLVRRTFDGSITSARGDCFLFLLDGANHLTLCHPHDTTTARGFLDFEPTQDENELRALISKLTCDFLDAYARNEPDAKNNLAQFAHEKNNLIAEAKQK